MNNNKLFSFKKELLRASVYGVIAIAFANLIFFSIYCQDCHAALDEVQKLYDLHAGSVTVVPISRGESYHEVSSFWSENNLTMPFSAQDDRSVYSLFASGIVPRIYISDSSGHVVENFGDSYIPDYEELFSILFSAY